MIEIIATLIIVVIIVIAYYVFYGKSSFSPDYIYGYWTASDDFCEASEIDSMMMFIGPIIDKNKRQSSIIIEPDICQQSFELSYDKIKFNDKGIATFSMHLEFSEECQIPSDLTATLSVEGGMLTLYEDDTIYAKLFKDHEITSKFAGNDIAL